MNETNFKLWKEYNLFNVDPKVRTLKDSEIKDIYDKIIERVNAIKNVTLKKCALEILSDFKEKLLNVPATWFEYIWDKEILWSHHCYRWWLLNHILWVIENSIMIATRYESKWINLDLIIFWAALHDIWKSNEYNSDLLSGINKELLGHSYESTYIVNKYLDKYNIDELFKLQALHVIWSHMKDPWDWAALVHARMLEVWIINFADHIDAILEPTIYELEQLDDSHYFTSVNDNVWRPLMRSVIV